MDELDPDYEVSPNPDREAELHGKTWRDLQSANLAPLAVLLRSEFEIEATLRSAIANAIDGESAACRMEAVRVRRGRPIKDGAAAIREGDLNSESWRGLRSANLAPLAALLRSEFEIEGKLRSAIADAIEKKSEACRIEAVRSRRGTPVEVEAATRWRDLRIDAFVRTQAKLGGAKDAAVYEAEQKFRLSRTAIFDACKRAAAVRGSFPEHLRTALDAAFKQFDQE